MVNRLADGMYAVAIALWVGGLWAIGYVAAPTLFSQLGSMIAGNIAGRLFTAMAWVGVACASYLLLYLIVRRGWTAFKSTVFWIVVLMLLLTLAGHFGIQPIMEGIKAQAPREVMEGVMRDRFARWHGISSVLYLVQSLLGLALVVLQGRGQR